MIKVAEARKGGGQSHANKKGREREKSLSLIFAAVYNEVGAKKRDQQSKEGRGVGGGEIALIRATTAERRLLLATIVARVWLSGGGGARAEISVTTTPSCAPKQPMPRLFSRSVDHQPSHLKTSPDELLRIACLLGGGSSYPQTPIPWNRRNKKTPARES